MAAKRQQHKQTTPWVGEAPCLHLAACLQHRPPRPSRCAVWTQDLSDALHERASTEPVAPPQNSLSASAWPLGPPCQWPLGCEPPGGTMKVRFSALLDRGITAQRCVARRSPAAVLTPCRPPPRSSTSPTRPRAHRRRWRWTTWTSCACPPLLVAADHSPGCEPSCCTWPRPNCMLSRPAARAVTARPSVAAAERHWLWAGARREAASPKTLALTPDADCCRLAAPGGLSSTSAWHKRCRATAWARCVCCYQPVAPPVVELCAQPAPGCRPPAAAATALVAASCSPAGSVGAV
jgi:hypothetical protein